MKNIPKPLTLEEIIAQEGIEGSEEAYDDEHGFEYSGSDNAFLYYGGDESNGGKPFTGLYYELFPNGKLESYAKYENGMPIEGYYSFYESGTIKRYSYFSRDRMNNYCYYFDKEGNIEREDLWKNGRLIQKQFREKI